MSNILKQLTKLLYHTGRSKVDRRHRIKYSREFVEAMAVVDQSKLSEDRLADYILAWSTCDHLDEQEVTEVVRQLAYCGLDEEIIDLLPGVFTLSARGLCEPTVAADTLTSIMFLFDVPVSEGDQVADHLTHITTTTMLTVSETARILESLGPRARAIDHSLEDVSTDVERVARHDWVQNQSREEMIQTIQRVLTRQYDDKRRFYEGTDDE